MILFLLTCVPIVEPVFSDVDVVELFSGCAQFSSEARARGCAVRNFDCDAGIGMDITSSAGMLRLGYIFCAPARGAFGFCNVSAEGGLDRPQTSTDTWDLHDGAALLFGRVVSLARVSASLVILCDSAKVQASHLAIWGLQEEAFLHHVACYPKSLCGKPT